MIVEAIPQPAFRASITRAADVVFLGSVVLQGLHFVEHIAQVGQKFFLELPEARGILGAVFDFEWVHFGYNLALFLALWFVVGAWLTERQGASPGWSGSPARALLFAAGVQSYHLVEHSVKLTQHLADRCNACPGLLGNFGDLVWIHFTINLLVMAPMLIALIGITAQPSERQQGTRKENYDGNCRT